MANNSEPTSTNSPNASPATFVDAFEQMHTQLHDNLAALSQQLERWQDTLRGDRSFTPLADVEETDDAYLVEIELAGVKRGDIDITAVGRRLTVSGERKEKERVGVLRKRTRTVGKFYYEIDLPGAFDTDDVTAGLEHGVLTVKLPKPETERSRRIKVS